MGGSTKGENEGVANAPLSFQKASSAETNVGRELRNDDLNL